jgi:hypothetical protein
MREQFISEVKIERDFKYLGKAKVKWVFSVDLNQTGVEGIHLHCPDQTVDLYDIPEEEVAEDVFKPVTTETKISIESVECEHQLSEDHGLSGSIYPQTLEFYKKQTKLLF